MKVCIPIRPKQQGGGFYFLDHLRGYLDREGISHTLEISDTYDILFLNAWHVTYYQVMEAWRHNPEARLVHRIDGAARDYGRQDHVDAIQRRVSWLADRTIFQSEYCRTSTQQKFRVITQDGPVIWNPVDVDTFRPDGSRRELPGRIRICYATYSTNPMKGAPDLYRVAEANPDIDFMGCGRYDKPPALPNLHLLGLLGRSELAEVMRSCDVFLTFSRNEACPNVVLEAMASGLPVLYLDSGAAPELVDGAGAAITVETFRDQLDAALEGRDKFSSKARQRVLEAFHPTVVFPRYLEVMEEALSAPLRVSIRRRRFLTALARITEPVERGVEVTYPLRRRVQGKLRAMSGSRSH